MIFLVSNDGFYTHWNLGSAAAASRSAGYFRITEKNRASSWFFIVFADHVTLIDLKINWNLLHIIVQINNIER